MFIRNTGSHKEKKNPISTITEQNLLGFLKL